MLKPILPNIWEWSWFSEEKQLNFNGHLLTVGEHRILVDPPPLLPDEKTQVKRIGTIDYIVLTNRDHVREAADNQREFGCHLYVPELDAAQMEVKATRTYKDGELLPGGLWSIQLRDQKSPGESALFLQQGKGVLLVGDALIGKPAGAVCMLPAEKYSDAVKAKDALRRLLKYQFEALLVGDGESIVSDAKPVVAAFLGS
ncbi:hypothetical protein YTPLAS18_13120 [Nitrospira sp.]|nr:hypothetical protein YTPLAS18_13120 [Nitrospira sp.]